MDKNVRGLIKSFVMAVICAYIMNVDILFIKVAANIFGFCSLIMMVAYYQTWKDSKKKCK
ncbi:hypothetical protein [Clostridium grantii]|uniref:Uncharacterized protein n=1 Tax=Clostridium grantii DSM 8605 TaxID=1121316 RepID=A0A1M5SCV8_9CLOT|nr:hypothetical protein [Clostridium grantii]SHH36452.1 hypothetical protein SAMN02745207_00876 [Clostridium grantii DSM 8605]